MQLDDFDILYVLLKRKIQYGRDDVNQRLDIG